MQIFCGKFKHKIENNMKVTKKDILSIRAGSSTKFTLPDYESCKSASSFAYQLNNSSDKPSDVERYKTSINAKACSITIAAIERK